MNILQHLLKDILIKFKDEKIPNDLKNINLERKKYNNELNNLLKSDNLIIEKYYKLQSGGAVRQTFDATTIAQLENLNNILRALGNIQPGQINDKTQKIKKITDDIIAEINQIASTDIDVNKLFDKIPQILNTAQININSTTKGFKIGSELANLTIPLDISGVQYDANGKITGDFINSKKLNEMMSRMKQSYYSLNTSISSGTSVTDTEFSRVKSEIENNIRMLNEQKTKLETINTELTKKITDFDKIHNDIRIDINDLKFKDIHQTAKDVEQYINNNPTPEDKTIMEKVIKFAYKSNTTNIESDRNLFIKNNEVEFAKQYNENVNKLSTLDYTVNSTTRKLPDKCYRGSDTKAIANNILNESLSNTTSLMESVKSLLNSNIEDFKEPSGLNVPNRFKTDKFEQIYKPQFGGNIDEIKILLKELNETSVGYRTVYKQFVKLTEMYNKYAIYELMHSIYLLSILSNSLFAKGGYQVYKYIGRGMVNFYKRIIEKIFKELQRDKASFEVPSNASDEIKQSIAESQLLLLEIRKKYYLTILILKKFLDNLSQILTPNDIIDIDECNEKVIQYFTLLNHFKTILEKYNETQMNKLTIFSRVNDIGMSGDLKNGEMQNLDLKMYKNITQQYYNEINANTDYQTRLQYNIDNKLFVSDFLRRNIYTGYYIKNKPHVENNIPLDINQNDLLNLEIRKFSDISGVFTEPTLQTAYDEIKRIFELQEEDNKKIELLEKYKKDTLSKEVGVIFTQNYNNKLKLDKINQEITDKEIEIAGKITEIEDTIENPGADAVAKKADITISKQELINLNTELDGIKNILRSNTDLDEIKINTIYDEITKIILTMKIALEYLYATSSQINEKLMWVRNETCDAQKAIGCTVPTPNNPYNTNSTDPNTPTPCQLPANVPYLNSYKFTEVFDTQNFPNNQDMAAYMCLNTRISSGNGVCLITYGYSGTGKSYTLFGAPGKSGLLQGTLGKLDGLDKVYFRTFEIYGKGLPYVDYWYDETNTIDPNNPNRKLTNTKNTIYNYLYAYKLENGGKNFVEGIKVIKPETQSDFNKPDDEWAVELKGDQINNYIDKSTILSNNIKTNGNTSTEYTKTTPDGKNDILKYMEIGNNEYQDLFSNFSKFTDKIEEMRIRTQRVRETPNNKVSSRSILIYDFVLVINKDNQKLPVNFLIIDLPGREEIAPTFINKYTDYKTNPVLYNIIKSEFIKDYKSSSSTLDSNYKKLFKTGLTNDDLGEIYMKELRAMLCAFTLNPLAVPVFACEIIEKYIKDNYVNGKNLKEIIERKEKKTITLYGEINRVFLGNTLTLTDVEFSLLDDFYTENYSEKIFIAKPGFHNFINKKTDQIISVIDITNTNYKYAEQIIKYGIGWYSFRNQLKIDASGNIVIYNDYTKDDYQKIIDEFNKLLSGKISYNAVKTKKVPPAQNNNPTSKSAYRNPYGLENNKYNGRQIKVLFLTNLIKRLIKTNRYDILNDMFEKIIFEKINKYIKSFIDNKEQRVPSKITFDVSSNITQLPTDLNSLIENLIENNFKRDALKDKFIKDGNYISKNQDDTINIKINKLGEFQIADKSTQFLEKQSVTSNYKEYILDAIKYDFYTTGFEGVYINENIIGLIKYLGKDGKQITLPDGTIKMSYLIQSSSDRDMIDIPEQNKDNIIELGKKQANLIMISRTDDEKQLEKALTSTPQRGGAGGVMPDYYNDMSGNTKKYINQDVSGIERYITDIFTYLDNLGSSTDAPFIKEMRVKAAEGRGAIMYPQTLKYDENSKLKNIHINKKNYLNSIYIKQSIDSIDKSKLGITVQGANTDGTKEAGIITDPSGLLDYYYDASGLDQFFNKTIQSYQSSKIFCFDEPIIKTILNPYLDVIGDFKIFYLFGNYEKAVRELKCKQQYELLETTNNFIEAITR